MDLEYIESELELEIPDVYRMFLQEAHENAVDLESHGFFHDEERLVEFNQEMAEEWPQWESSFLAFGPNDGCGNWFVIDASAIDADNVLLVLHDPIGVETVGAASRFLPGCLESGSVASVVPLNTMHHVPDVSSESAQVGYIEYNDDMFQIARVKCRFANGFLDLEATGSFGKFLLEIRFPEAPSIELLEGCCFNPSDRQVFDAVGASRLEIGESVLDFNSINVQYTRYNAEHGAIALSFQGEAEDLDWGGLGQFSGQIECEVDAAV